MLTILRNSIAAFNRLNKTIELCSHPSHKSYPYCIRKMHQPSITSFFKTKIVEKAKKVEEEEIASNHSDDNGFTTEDEDEPQEVPIPREVTKKRPLESDDSDDEVIKSSSNSKRVLLSSAESTPVKVKEETKKYDEASGDSVKMDVAKSGDVDVKTPSKARQLFEEKPTAQSPLFNIELIVKKKISSGAYALHENIGVTWFKALQNEFDKPYFKKLSTFVQDQRKSNTVYPPPEQVFTWTHYHAIRETRVVIIGQDPYHGPNQAHGLSFSVQHGIAIPKSLQNIYKELQNDIPNFKHPGHGNLTGWSKQGVLLLNACLTVTKGQANSHQGKGWETFTDAVISWISKNVNHNVVFLLWGRFAQKKSALIDKRHKILNAAHPSPLSADNGFFYSKPFSKTNEYLRSQKLTEIDWSAL